MALFEHFPYTNYHELNLDWLVEQVKKNSAALDLMIVKITKNSSVYVSDTDYTRISEALTNDVPVFVFIKDGATSYLASSIGKLPDGKIAMEMDLSYNASTATLKQTVLLLASSGTITTIVNTKVIPS